MSCWKVPEESKPRTQAAPPRTSQVFSPIEPEPSLARDAIALLVATRGAPDEKVEIAELTELLCAEIGRLPSDDAAMVTQCLFEGTPFNVVAQSLGITRSGGTRRLARATALLGKRLALAAR